MALAKLREPDQTLTEWEQEVQGLLEESIAANYCGWSRVFVSGTQDEFSTHGGRQETPPGPVAARSEGTPISDRPTGQNSVPVRGVDNFNVLCYF